MRIISDLGMAGSCGSVSSDECFKTGFCLRISRLPVQSIYHARGRSFTNEFCIAGEKRNHGNKSNNLLSFDESTFSVLLIGSIQRNLFMYKSRLPLHELFHHDPDNTFAFKLKKTTKNQHGFTSPTDQTASAQHPRARPAGSSDRHCSHMCVDR